MDKQLVKNFNLSLSLNGREQTILADLTTFIAQEIYNKIKNKIVKKCDRCKRRVIKYNSCRNSIHNIENFLEKEKIKIIFFRDGFCKQIFHQWAESVKDSEENQTCAPYLSSDIITLLAYFNGSLNSNLFFEIIFNYLHGRIYSIYMREYF